MTITNKHILQVRILALVLLASAGSAQQAGNGSISGVVHDPSGASLPGVAVEASSPVLIEKSKSVVTDSQGAYRIIDLTPGTYTVRFSAAGFSTIETKDLELPAGFAATVNADMKVGAVQDTVTVTGEAPVVDTQNVAQQRNFASNITQNLPIGSGLKAYATLIPGSSYGGGASQQDVGGNKSEFQQQFTVHDSRGDDFMQLRNGMFFGTMVAAGNWMSSLNPSTISEVEVHTDSSPAEISNGGVVINVVTRSGGNNFHGTFQGAWTNSDLQASNLDSSLAARGVTAANSIRKRYDYGGGVGGPIMKDKLWFYVSARSWDTATNYGTDYYNLTPGTIFYTPNLSKPAYEESYYKDGRAQLTYQATASDKIAATFGYEWNCNCPGTFAGTTAPESVDRYVYHPDYQGEVNWTHIVNSHFLLEVSGVVVNGFMGIPPNAGYQNVPTIVNNTFGYTYGGAGTGFGLGGSTGGTADGGQSFGETNQQAAITYVSGAHTMKTGFRYLRGWRSSFWYFDSPAANYTSWIVTGPLNDPVPSAVVYYAGPVADQERQADYDFFAQDQWKIKRLTLNYGVRYEGLRGWAPAVNEAAGPWVPARSYPEVKNIPDWNNWDPRIGAAYDLFGNGKTAIKAFVGRFEVFEPILNVTASNAPVNLTTLKAQRSWTDTNGNFIPDGNPLNPAANGELGPLSVSTFGQTTQTTTYSNDVLHGNRPYDWQENASIDQQLWVGASLSVGYFRRSYGNFRVFDNTAVTPQDFTSYCITSPTSPFLPTSVSGSQICGLYDVNPNKFGQVTNLVTLASKFGKVTEVFNGIDVTFKTRLPGRGYLQAGMATGSTVTDDCSLNNLPNVQLAILGTGATNSQTTYNTSTFTPRTSAFCHISPPWWDNTQFKMVAVYPLPWWKLQVSGNLQNTSPIPTPATASIGNAAIAPSLGRNLSACPSTGTCNVSQVYDVLLPNMYFREPRVNQIDLRISRTFTFGREWQVQPNIDLFNVLNSSAVEGINSRLGASYNYVTTFLDPRVLRLSVNVNF